MSGAPSEEASRKQKKKQREKEKKLQQRARDASGVGGAAAAAAASAGGTTAAAPPLPPSAATPLPMPAPPEPPAKPDTAVVAPSNLEAAPAVDARPIDYVDYEDERQLPAIMEMVDKDLSEPYSVFTYRYFLHTWPGLCIRALCDGELVGVVICKAEREASDRAAGGDGDATAYRGYIAMLAVSRAMRRRGLGTALVLQAVRRMVALGCDEAMLETEVTNQDSLRLYGKLGFVREDRLVKYYLNGVDAFRLKLWFDPKTLQLGRPDTAGGSSQVGVARAAPEQPDGGDGGDDAPPPLLSGGGGGAD